MSDQISNKVIVSVESEYVPQQSYPDRDRYVFSYTVTISNDSDTDCQLLSRHWLINDAHHKQEEVYGEGVVGQQPVIAPGSKFQYTSGAVLKTDFGTMEGRYFMIKKNDEGSAEEFEINIPKFVLSVPRTLH